MNLSTSEGEAKSQQREKSTALVSWLLAEVHCKFWIKIPGWKKFSQKLPNKEISAWKTFPLEMNLSTGSTLPQWFHETVGSTGSLLVKHRGFEGLMIWLHQHWQKFLWEPSWLGVVFSSAPLFSQWYSPCQIKNLPQIRTLTHHVTWLSLSLDLQLYWRQLAVAQDPKDDAI